MKLSGVGGANELFLAKSRATDELVGQALAKIRSSQSVNSNSGKDSAKLTGADRAADRIAASGVSSTNPKGATTASSALTESKPSNETTVSVPDGEESSISPVEIRLNDLAALYVQQYQSGAGVILSEKAAETLTKEVATFYSKYQDGEQRLDEIVFLNDEETKTQG